MGLLDIIWQKSKFIDSSIALLFLKILKTVLSWKSDT